MEHQLYSYYRKPPQIGLSSDQPTMTQQHFTDECDINQILAKFAVTGYLDTIGPGVYADLGDAKDYRESVHLLMEADAMFAALPSNIRARFENDPAQYMDFVHNPDNLAEGIELGIFTSNPTILPIKENPPEEGE